MMMMRRRTGRTHKHVRDKNTLLGAALPRNAVLPPKHVQGLLATRCLPGHAIDVALARASRSALFAATAWPTQSSPARTRTVSQRCSLGARRLCP
eukprot:8952960-Pyramimonas_sp.AAC.1